MFRQYPYMTIFEKIGILPAVKERIKDKKILADLRRVPAVRLEFEIGKTDILYLLPQIKSASKIYWRNRSCLFESVAAVNIYNNRDLTINALQGLVVSGLRFYISQKFDLAGNITAKWRNFGRIFVFLPLWSIERRNDKYLFILNYSKELANLCVKTDINQISEFELAQEEKEVRIPLPETVQFLPSRRNWNNAVNTSIELINLKAIRKIVLSRLVKYEFQTNISSAELFVRLAEHSPESYNFYFRPANDSVFMGISPELLVKKDGNNIFCDVLAGTCERTGDEIRDKHSAEVLLSDPKELEEHRIVAGYIKHRLSRISDNVCFEDKEQIKKLQNIQHIYSSLRCETHKDISIYDIIMLLSPTPAVCGFPQSRAFEVIDSLEMFDRGHYSGTLGTICGDDAEICVAIRSALMWKNRLYVYAGAGILAESDADREWTEIDNKMKNFSDYFTK